MMDTVVNRPRRMSNSEGKSSSHNRESVEKLGDQGGYFDLVVKPMLQQGHEGELCSWLKEMSLIRTESNCPQVNCKGRNLIWNPARIVDKYNWACPACTRKQSIRENSFFLSVKCDLKMCLQVILGWCQLVPSRIMAEHLDIKEHVVKKVYERCAKVSEAYVSGHPEEWVLGGPGTVLIVDEFPGGCMTETVTDTVVTKKRNNNSHTILCIAEANVIPPRMWLHMIRAMPEPLKSEKGHTNVNRCGMVEEALKEVVRHALPGSYIVANSRARSCNYESLQELKQYRVISVEYLQKFDPPGKNKLLSNLETIWQTGVKVCEEIQETTHALGLDILSTYLWRQRFGTSPSTAFQYMLNHIAEFYRFT
ncbi:uncharacterized protein LOC105698267 [Orussus abietinus]|uniref:uncharacterized protein LOC105698267 n=1 Tax=Orussus abietinus TaxID=222816 RepID=UPI0006260323|nr:uncharacterized protein LOC105698267 [Orussus abietinus]